uniref:Uncharacterized protein n=1 Tax=Chromera velia CCMP2878 TaxID=1169474 RepID=A0A0G4FV11_9ALVE|eukprot:Cvel_18796.t1-p1 / transcript=Cvel_18796.t1 / gene=Cvel_18796 / organism=Chromera_velia_CCMP2878 / gene_product=hypothetical protein / transcript_product=hypothetical protein / location=Cvel_scaffold1578:35679-42837(-) / protein_length=1071 / sequence_SO=supercontig / SO=protein_coding / is_pseudo=false
MEPGVPEFREDDKIRVQRRLQNAQALRNFRGSHKVLRFREDQSVELVEQWKILQVSPDGILHCDVEESPVPRHIRDSAGIQRCMVHRDRVGLPNYPVLSLEPIVEDRERTELRMSEVQRLQDTLREPSPPTIPEISRADQHQEVGDKDITSEENNSVRPFDGGNGGREPKEKETNRQDNEDYEVSLCRAFALLGSYRKKKGKDGDANSKFICSGSRFQLKAEIMDETRYQPETVRDTQQVETDLASTITEVVQKGRNVVESLFSEFRETTSSRRKARLRRGRKNKGKREKQPVPSQDGEPEMFIPTLSSDEEEDDEGDSDFESADEEEGSSLPLDVIEEAFRRYETEMAERARRADSPSDDLEDEEDSESNQDLVLPPKRARGNPRDQLKWKWMEPNPQDAAGSQSHVPQRVVIECGGDEEGNAEGEGSPHAATAEEGTGHQKEGSCNETGEEISKKAKQKKSTAPKTLPRVPLYPQLTDPNSSSLRDPESADPNDFGPLPRLLPLCRPAFLPSIPEGGLTQQDPMQTDSPPQSPSAANPDLPSIGPSTEQPKETGGVDDLNSSQEEAECGMGTEEGQGVMEEKEAPRRSRSVSVQRETGIQSEGRRSSKRSMSVEATRDDSGDLPTVDRRGDREERQLQGRREQDPRLRRSMSRFSEGGREIFDVKIRLAEFSACRRRKKNAHTQRGDDRDGCEDTLIVFRCGNEDCGKRWRSAAAKAKPESLGTPCDLCVGLKLPLESNHESTQLRYEMATEMVVQQKIGWQKCDRGVTARVRWKGHSVRLTIEPELFMVPAHKQHLVRLLKDSTTNPPQYRDIALKRDPYGDGWDSPYSNRYGCSRPDGRGERYNSPREADYISSRFQADLSTCLQRLKMNTMPATTIPGVLPAELVLMALNSALHNNKQKAFSVRTFSEQEQLIELDKVLQRERLEREELRRIRRLKAEQERAPVTLKVKKTEGAAEEVQVEEDVSVSVQMEGGQRDRDVNGEGEEEGGEGDGDREIQPWDESDALQGGERQTNKAASRLSLTSGIRPASVVQLDAMKSSLTSLLRGAGRGSVCWNSLLSFEQSLFP